MSVVKTNNEAEMFSYALADNDRAGYYEEDKVAELVLQNPTLKLDLHKLDLGQQTSIEEILERFGPYLCPERSFLPFCLKPLFFPNPNANN